MAKNNKKNKKQLCQELQDKLAQMSVADRVIYQLTEGLSDKERENSVNEVRILASIRSNSNVIRYYEAFMD